MKPILIFLVAFFGIAVPSAKSNSSGDDTTRIHACRNFFNLTATVTKPIFSASLSNRDENQTLQYRTVNPLRLGLAFDYRWFGIELSTQIPTFKAQNIRKGKTDNSSLRFSINSRRFWFTAMLQTYKGFYLNNDGYFYNPISTQNPLPKRPDIFNSIVQVSGFYIFNHRHFSNPAAIGQYERQLKSGGSPFVGIGLLGNTLKADSSFVPGPVQRDFPNIRNVREINSLNICLSAGYAYMFVYRQKYFLALYGAPGMGWFKVTEKMANQVENQGRHDFGIRFETRAVLGFNGLHWYYGGGYFGYWNNERLISGNYIMQTFQNFRFFVGRRFSTRRSLGFLGL